MGCDNLIVAFDEENAENQTEFLLISPKRQIKIVCVCADQSERLEWFFNDGTKVPQQGSGDRVHFREKNKPRRDGNTLVIRRGTPSLEYVGVYRCKSDVSNSSTTIIIKGIVYVQYIHSKAYVRNWPLEQFPIITAMHMTAI